LFILDVSQKLIFASPFSMANVSLIEGSSFTILLLCLEEMLLRLVLGVVAAFSTETLRIRL